MDMKKAVFASLALCACSGAATAADLAVKAKPIAVNPAINWSGFYIGVNGGYGWNDSQDVAVSGTPLIVVSQPGTIPFAVTGLKSEGFLVGGTVGWNYQFGRGVAGIEADFDYADIKSSRNVDLPVIGANVRTSASEKIDFFGTLRGRVGGLLTDNFLLYATGGLAYANVQHDGNVNEFFNAPGTGRQFTASSSDLRFGWTVGAGAEWAFTRNWSLKGEYLYYDLGHQTVTGRQSNPVNNVDLATYSFTTRGNIGRVGLNYKF